MLCRGGETDFGVVAEVPLLVDFNIGYIVSSNSASIVYDNSIEFILLIGPGKR